MKIKDRILLGTIAGAVGAAAAYMLGAAAKGVGLEQRTWAERAKKLVVSQDKSKGIADTTGILANEAIGILGGIPLVYAHTLTGRDKGILKGAVYGSLMWLTVYGLGRRAIGDSKSKPAAALTNLFTNIIYGTVAATIITRLGDDSLFPRKQQDESDMEDAEFNDISNWADTNHISPRRIEDLH